MMGFTNFSCQRKPAIYISEKKQLPTYAMLNAGRSQTKRHLKVPKSNGSMNQHISLRSEL